MKMFLRRTLVLLFTFVAIFGSAASCNLFGEDNNSNLRYGLLKSDPEVYQGGFAFVNTVKTFKDFVDTKGLNAQSGIKLVQFNKDKLYYIAQNKGLFKTTNSGKEWQRIYIFPIKGNDKKTWDEEIANNDSLKINDISFVNEETFYVAGTKGEVAYLYKTTDSGTTFNQVYNTQSLNKKVFIEQVLVDSRADRQNTVFITTSGGGLFKSDDAGNTWKVVNIADTEGDTPLQIGIMPNYNNRIYILYKNIGLYISDDGVTFTKKTLSIGEQNPDGFSFGLSSQPIDKIILSPVSKDVIILSNRSIYKADTLDSNFVQIKLPVESKSINLTDVAVDPREGMNRLLVTIDNKLFETKDKGTSWSANDKIRQENIQYGNIGQIVIDPEDTRIVYLMLIDPTYRRGNSSGFFFGF
jgi:photosystem II stability/assembly factor-like uncharacterized protein